MDVRYPLHQTHRREGNAVALYYLRGFIGELSLRRCGIEYHGHVFFSEVDNVNARADCTQVEHCRPAGNEAEVSRTRGSKGAVFRVRCRVNEYEVSAVLFCRFQNLRQPGGLGRYHGRRFVLAGISPECRACLRVKVDDSCALAIPLGRNRKVYSERGFARAALL